MVRPSPPLAVTWAKDEEYEKEGNHNDGDDDEECLACTDGLVVVPLHGGLDVGGDLIVFPPGGYGKREFSLRPFSNSNEDGYFVPRVSLAMVASCIKEVPS